MQDPAAFNPLSPEFQANPYAFYGMLRENAPLLYWPGWSMWFATRYDDCTALLREKRLGHEIRQVMTREQLGWEPWDDVPPKHQRRMELERHWMLLSDPPRHTRLRGLVHKAFTPRRVEELRQRSEAIVNRLIDDALAKGGTIDLIEDFAFPLPVTLIAEMLGVPVADQEQFRRWSRGVATMLEMTDDPAVYEQGTDDYLALDAYFRTLVARYRAAPEDNLLSGLLAAEDAGDTLTEDEIVGTCTLLLVAGHETTVNLIGNGVNALLDHPAEYAKLVADPALAKTAVEELLRYDSPVQMTTRWIMENFDYGGMSFKRGQQIALLLGAANHDPDHFPNPTTLDLSRESAKKHIAFGNGIHFCLGAPLARLEGQVAFEQLARRAPQMQRAGDAVHRGTFVLRGYKQMPVHLMSR